MVFADVKFLEKRSGKWGRIASLLVASVFMTGVQIVSSSFFEPGYFSYSFLFFTGLTCSLLLISWQMKGQKDLKLNLPDLFFLAFLFIVIIRGLDSFNSWIYSKSAVALALLPVFFFVKGFRYNYLIHIAVVLAALVQVFVALLQLSGIVANSNPFFKTGGLPGNPNVLAMVLVISIPSVLLLWQRAKTCILRILLVILVILLIGMVMVLKCRTAILGMAAIYGILLVKIWKQNLFPHGRGLLVLLLLLLLAGFTFLVVEKSGSLTGRWVIWQSGFLKIAERPLWGHGISSFHLVYPVAQRQFLEQNRDQSYLEVADTPLWAYNDFLEFWIEGGVFVSVAFLLMLLSAVYSWGRQKRFNLNGYNLSFLPVVAFFVFACFNFAYTAWPVLLIFGISLASASRMTPGSIPIRFSKIPVIGLSLALVLLAGNAFLAARAVENLLFQSHLKRIETRTTRKQGVFYEKHRERYALYTPFAFKHAAFLFSGKNQGEAIRVLVKAFEHEPSYNTSFRLAEAYSSLNEFDSAVHYYREAEKFLPNRMMPSCNQFMIAVIQGRKEVADSIRNQVMQKKFKGDPLFINRLKNSLWEKKVE